MRGGNFIRQQQQGIICVSALPPVNLWGNIISELNWNEGTPTVTYDAIKLANTGQYTTFGLALTNNADSPNSVPNSLNVSGTNTTTYYAGFFTTALAQLASSTDFTVMVWMKNHNIQADGYDQVLGTSKGINSSDGTALCIYNLHLDSYGVFIWTRKNSVTTDIGCYQSGVGVLTKGAWNLFTLRWHQANNQWSTSINNSHRVAFNAGANTPYFGADARAGLGHLVSDWVGGQGMRWKYLRTFNRFLTDHDINAHWNSGVARVLNG